MSDRPYPTIDALSADGRKTSSRRDFLLRAGAIGGGLAGLMMGVEGASAAEDKSALLRPGKYYGDMGGFDLYIIVEKREEGGYTASFTKVVANCKAGDPLYPQLSFTPEGDAGGVFEYCARGKFENPGGRVHSATSFSADVFYNRKPTRVNFSLIEELSQN